MMVVEKLETKFVRSEKRNGVCALGPVPRFVPRAAAMDPTNDMGSPLELLPFS